MFNFFHANNQACELQFQTTATTLFHATIYKIFYSSVRWELDGVSKIVDTGVEVIHSFPDNSVKTVKLQVDNYANVSSLSMADNSIVGDLDISKFEKLNFCQIYNNSFSSVKFPTSSNNMTVFHVHSIPTITSLNLSGLTGLGGDIRLQINIINKEKQ